MAHVEREVVYTVRMTEEEYRAWEAWRHGITPVDPASVPAAPPSEPLNPHLAAVQQAGTVDPEDMADADVRAILQGRRPPPKPKAVTKLKKDDPRAIEAEKMGMWGQGGQPTLAMPEEDDA